MGYQQGSIDISNLQAVALGSHDAAVIGKSQSLRARGSQKPTPSLHSLHARASTATSKFAKTSSQNNKITKKWEAKQDQKLRNTTSRASQGNVPRKVVSNASMHSNSTVSPGDTQKDPDWWAYGEKARPHLSPGPSVTNEDETGHINLVDGLEISLPAEENPVADNGETNEENDEESDDNEGDDGNDEAVELVSQELPAEDIRAEPFPESRRFQQPMTPHITGAKRKRPEEEETPQMPTPRLPVNPFAGLATSDMMRPSQIFHATQAQTSPLLVHSDMLSERPSPEVNNFGRPSTAGSLSSPVARRDHRLAMARAVTEPQGNYVSLKESQEARERRSKQPRVIEADPFDDEFEQQSHSQPTRGSTVGKSMAITGSQSSKKLFASTSLQHLDSKARAPSLRARSMMERGKQQSPVLLTSDPTPPPEGSGNISEDETEREEEKEERPIDDEIDELAEDNKENVEVPMTVSRQHRGQMVTSQPSPSRNRVRSSIKKSAARSATQVVRSPHRTNPLSGSPISEKDRQPYAVRDSQSSQQYDIQKLPAPCPLHSSLENSKVVPQSQASQKSRSSVPQSSVPSRSAASNEVINLILSSPLQANEAQNVAPQEPSSLAKASRDLSRGDAENNQPSNEVIVDVDPSASADQVQSSTESERPQKSKPQMPASLKSTIPETSSGALRERPLPHTVPGSSQDTHSSRQIASSTPRLATDQSLRRQSLGTTLYETAPDHLSPSPPKRWEQGSQVLPRESAAASPLKPMKRRTLNEITADPSPPDIAEHFELSALDILSKDDEMFHNAIQGRVQPEAMKGRQDQSPHDPSLGRMQLVSNHVERRAVTSTRWKSFTSDLPFEHPGSPVRPTSSAISQPTQIPEAAISSSSPLSTPPASYDGESSSCVASDITQGKPASPEGPLSQEAQPEPVQNRDLATASGFSSSLPVLAPDRVFAHFNGRSSFFYTATCLGVIPGDEPRYSVRYDDGAEACVSAFGIKRLQFKPGDVVKVEMEGYKNRNYVVVGMAEQHEVDDPDALADLRKHNPGDTRAWPETDIYGHAKVILVPKRVQSATSEQEDEAETVVGMYNLYLTQAMWTNIRDREYVHVGRRATVSGDPQTPVDRPSRPSSPSSRLKRLKAAPLIQSTYTAGPKQSLFGNMVFTLTNIPQPTELERTKSLIVAHGGKVLEDGFGLLFHVPILHRITSPKKSDSDRDFHPTREAHSLGFTCLIADKHCRRAKYIQALALGIPCLATRWISDCITKQRLLPWSAYLLPAGESAFLGGATHSRVLPAWPAETTTLSKLLDHRPHLLKGSSILLIMSKNEEESMRQYPLLTFALSPARVARALSIEAAARAAAEAHAVGEPWDWVFSYDREREVEKVLFGSTAKKRKARGLSGGLEVRTRVIGNEFVIQSLISGQLLEE